MPIYKLKPLELHTGYYPTGAEWKNVVNIDPPPAPTWVPGEPLVPMPNYMIPPEPSFTPPENPHEDYDNGDGWIFGYDGLNRYCWMYMSITYPSSVNGWVWNFTSRVWEYYGSRMGATESNGWIWDGSGWIYSLPQQTRADLENVFIPDQLIIYFYVHDKGINDDSGWSPHTNLYEIENDIVELGELRMGFDEEEYAFALEDITFKVQNDSGVWDEILHPDMVTSVRIIHTHIIKLQNGSVEYHEPRPIFYGIIDKSNIPHRGNVGFHDVHYGKYREYEFTALNYFSSLKEVSIKELREAIKNDGYDYSRIVRINENLPVPSGVLVAADERGWTRDIVDGYNSNNMQGFPSAGYVRYDVRYITLIRVFRNIFNLIFPDSDSLVIKSDTEFKNAAINDVWKLDSNTTDSNVCIYFGINVLIRPQPSGSITYDDIYRSSFFDDDTSRSPWSFFKHENCLSLLKELLINFGLVWRADYEILDTVAHLYRWHINFELLTRFEGNNVNDFSNDDVHNDIEGATQSKKFDGAQINVTNYGDVTDTIEEDRSPLPSAIIYATPTDKTKKLSTPFASWEHDKTKTLYTPHNTMTIQQSLFGYANDRMIPINRYTTHFGFDGSITETYPKYYPPPPTRLSMGEEVPAERDWDNMLQLHARDGDNAYKQFFGQMVINYYAGKYGIYTNFIRNSLRFTVDRIDIEPLDTITINEEQYIVMQVEKDFLKGISKLTLKEYKIST